MIDQAQSLRDLVQKSQTLRANKTSSSQKISQAKTKKARFITVISGKGGVGKSNIALNLAIAYGSIGKKTVILDADLGMANVNVLMGIIPRYNISHILSDYKKFKDVVLETEYGVSLIAGASGISELADADELARAQFLSEIQELDNYDVVIIDTGAGASSNVVAFAAAADDVILVTTQEPTSLTDAYSMVKILSKDSQFFNRKLHLIINRVYSSVEGKKVADKLLGISQQFLNMPLEYLGFVYEDAFVREAVKKQKPFFWGHKKSRSSQCISQLVSKLENIESSPRTSSVGYFFSKFFKSFS